MKRKYFIIAILAALMAVVLYKIWIGGAWKIPKTSFAGSYTSAERWRLHIQEHDLIDVINKVKKKHPELEPPNSYPNANWYNYWYLVDFYYKDTNEDVFTYLRKCSDSDYTTFAFIAVS